VQPFTSVTAPRPTAVGNFITAALEQHKQGTALAFATKKLDSGEIVGSSRYMNLEYWPHRDLSPSTSEVPDALEIGSTWLAASAQRTAVNTEAKLRMLTHAFEVYGVKRVNFKTDARNSQSRANIERVGAVLEGVLRHHQRSADGANNGIRDTAAYSILVDEWPAAKSALQARLR
jgi:RimJ/RimL family protein N-acetyltransferase